MIIRSILQAIPLIIFIVNVKEVLYATSVQPKASSQGHFQYQFDSQLRTSFWKIYIVQIKWILFRDLDK